MAEKIKNVWRRLPLFVRVFALVIAILACGFLPILYNYFTPVLEPETPPTGATNSHNVFTSLSYDGAIRNSDSDYNLCWNASSGNYNMNTSSNFMIGQRTLLSTYYISRGFLFFNTEGLPITAEILGVNLSICIYGDYSDTDFNITVYIPEAGSSRPNIPIDLDDYDQSFYNESTEVGRLSTVGISVGSYINISLSAEAVKAGEITKLILRSDRDFDKVIPTGREYVTIYTNESDYPPKLYVKWRFSPQLSATERALRDPYQRKCFYAEERAWVFFNNGTWLVYTSSNDTENWKTPKNVFSEEIGNFGEYASIFFDGTYVHCVQYSAITYDLRYRRGRPCANGTILWNDEFLVWNGSQHNRIIMPYIGADTDGYPWIVGQWIYNATNSVLHLLKGKFNNGTWQVEFEKNFTLTDGALALAPRGIVIPLRNEKIAVVYCVKNGYVYVDIWNGTAWIIEEEQASLNTCYHGDFMTAVAVLDDIHISYNTYDKILYRKRIWGTGWEPNETVIIDDVTYIHGAVMSWANTNNTMYIFWTNGSNQINYRPRYPNGTWGNTVAWITTSEPLTTNRTLHVAFKSETNMTVFYMTGTSPPYKINYAYLSFPSTTSTINATIIGATDNAANKNSAFYAYWESNLGLDFALFYWNASGTMELNGTFQFAGQPTEAWSNFTRLLPQVEVIAWYIVANDTSGNWGNTSIQILDVITYTELVVGWNNFTAWSVDVGKTLSQVNASLHLDNINWTVISLEYSNGSRAVLVWEQDTNEYIGQEGAVVESGCTFYIYCKEAGEWYHNYP